MVQTEKKTRFEAGLLTFIVRHELWDGNIQDHADQGVAIMVAADVSFHREVAGAIAPVDANAVEVSLLHRHVDVAILNIVAKGEPIRATEPKVDIRCAFESPSAVT